MEENNSNINNDIIPMPSLAVKILNAIKNPATADEELTKIIQEDSEFETKTLKVVNSPYFNFRQKITSVNKAIVLLGAMKIKNIILTLAMKQAMVSHADYELWEHSVKCAVAAEFIAQKYQAMNSDDAFVIGFMHDIGKLMLNAKNPLKYSKVKFLAQKANEALIDVENAQFKTNHCAIGAEISRSWMLPNILTNSIKFHHDPLNSSIPSISSVVYCADRLVQKEIPTPIFEPEVLAKLEFKIEDPIILRETILTKASIYLKEISG